MEILRRKRGQSTLEYVLVITAIIAAILLGARTFLKRGVETGMTNAALCIEEAADQFASDAP